MGRKDIFLDNVLKGAEAEVKAGGIVLKNQRRSTKQEKDIDNIPVGVSSLEEKGKNMVQEKSMVTEEKGGR